MPTLAVTNTFVAGADAEASEVNQNFTDIVSFTNTNVIQKDGSVAMSGHLTLGAGDPTSGGHAARKTYVDTQVSKGTPTIELDTVTGGGYTTGQTVASVTITDPGYAIYVWANATIAFTSNQTTDWASWYLGIEVAGTLRDAIVVPVSKFVTTNMSMGVPLRRILRATGANTTVAATVTRTSGNGNLTVPSDTRFSRLEVWWARA